ncbi:MAG: FixH family protein [Gammaproteobacteria bacterium]
MKQVTDSVAWYRQPLVLMLIFLPASVVVASFITLYLAIRSDDGLVEDDYYQRGKEINRVLDRDHAAQHYGLHAQLTFEPARRSVDVRLTATGKLPRESERLELKLSHATRAGQDQRVILVRKPDGHYQGILPSLGMGHWYVQLAAADWRLTGELHVPGIHTAELGGR